MLNSKIVCFTQARDFGIAVNVFWKELPKKFYEPKERLAYVFTIGQDLIPSRPSLNPKFLDVRFFIHALATFFLKIPDNFLVSKLFAYSFIFENIFLSAFCSGLDYRTNFH